MKFLLKVMFAPVIVVLAILVNVCSFALQLAGGILGIAASIIGIFGLAILVLDGLKNGLIILTLAFLISPYGLPMIGAWLIAQIQSLKFFIQDVVYS